MTVRRMTREEYRSRSTGVLEAKHKALCPICRHSIYGQYPDPEKYLEGPTNGLFCLRRSKRGIDYSSGTINEQWTKEDTCECYNQNGHCNKFELDKQKEKEFFKDNDKL